MHIGIDCRLPYYQMGGISQYVLHLIQALGRLDHTHQYTIFHHRKDERLHLPPDVLNFQRHDLWTPAHHRWERLALSLELWPYRLDVVHSPDFIPPAFGGKRRIITIHDLNFIYYPDLLTAESRRYYKDQIAWAVKQADHISADSEATRQDVIDLLQVAPDKITTIYLAANPIYRQPYSQTAVLHTLAHYNLPSGFILFVGTLEPRKNLPMLIQAYYQLRQETAVDVPLVLVGGKGWIYDEIFATIERLQLRQHVRHLSGVYDEQLAHLYCAAGVLVTPSHYEGFGLPALEAMHCGCPVVVSERGSLPEIVGPAGVTLPPDDVDLWVAMLHTVLSDSHKREEMVANGRLQAETFTWAKAAQKTLALYRGVV